MIFLFFSSQANVINTNALAIMYSQQLSLLKFYKSCSTIEQGMTHGMQTPSFSLPAQHNSFKLMVIMYARDIKVIGKDVFHFIVHKIPNDILLNLSQTVVHL